MSPYLIPASTGPDDPMRGLLAPGCVVVDGAEPAVVTWVGSATGHAAVDAAGGQAWIAYLDPALATSEGEVVDLVSVDSLLLDTRRTEVRDHIRRVLGQGERCWRLGWITDAELSGRLTNWQAAAIWACCVARVRAATWPVVGWTGEAQEDEQHGPIRAVSGPDIPGMLRNDFGGRWMRVADDADVLAQGFAILEADGAIILPYPDGPVRVEAP